MKIYLALSPDKGVHLSSFEKGKFYLMIKSTIALFLAFYFLVGSTILPLGDFSLMGDLSGMYKSYCQITAEKPDIFDFIGDYVMGGKYIFGHNKHDAPLKSDGSSQYQHQATSFLYYNVSRYQIHQTQEILIAKPIEKDDLLFSFNYTSKSLRPPIVG